LPEGGAVETGDGILVVEWTASDPNGDELTFTVDVKAGDTVVMTKFGVGNTTRQADLQFDLETLEDLGDLVVVVTAREVATIDLLEVNGTSGPFWFEVTGVDPDPEPGPDPVREEEVAVAFPWLMMGILAASVLVIVLIVVLVAMRSGTPSPPMAPAQGAPPPVGKVCDECGGPVSTENAFGQPYCAECDMYQ
jgi:hypothetical protein